MPPSYLKVNSPLDPRLQGPQSLPAAKTPQPGTEIHSSPRSLLTRGVVIIPKPQQPAKQVSAKDPTVPKRSRGRPRKAASAQPGGQAAASESTEDELEIEDADPPEMTPALLTLSMPSDERGKSLYRAVQAVWSPRNRPVDPDKVRNGIANYGETIRALRDAWKTRNETLRKAELPNSPTAADASRLKEEVARYRQLLEVVMVKSLQYGHMGIVKRYVTPQISLSMLLSPVPLCERKMVRSGLESTDRMFLGLPLVLQLLASLWLLKMKLGQACESCCVIAVSIASSWYIVCESPFL